MLIPLLAATLLGAAPTIELAVAERTGPRTARVTLVRADPRLEALCLDYDGLDPEVVEAARAEALRRPLWLYLGGRRIARGALITLGQQPSALGPCAVGGEASFDSPLPVVARGDLLWVSSDRHPSRPRLPVPRDAWRRARAALPPSLTQECGRPWAASARPTRGGTWLGFSCAAGGEAETASAIVYVPDRTDGEPRLALLERGERPLILLEVLDAPKATGAAGGARLALGRELEGGQRVELWWAGPAGAARIDGWRAY